MKRFLALLLAFAVFFSLPLAAFSESPQPDASPKAELLYEAYTGRVLYSKNPDAKLPIASITKTMSLLIFADAIENGTLSLDEKIRASAAASAAEGSTIWLETGEQMSAAELLEAVILNSANDACVALAEHLAGSEADFVKLMNARAAELGLKSTRFSCCTGLDDDKNYSSAKDIAVITAALMSREVFRGWFLTWLDYLRGGDTQLVNTNKLIKTYDGILGGKTGTTDAAGYCLTVCAERKGMRLVAVTLGCESDSERFSRCEELLDYGFDGFEKFEPSIDFTKLLPIKVTRGVKSETIPIVKRQGEECVIKRSRAADVKYEYTFVEYVEAPVEKGQFLGEYLVTLDGTEVFRSEIIAAEDISRLDFWRCLAMVLKEFITM